MNKPYDQKLTQKGDVSDKLRAKGVQSPESIRHFVIELDVSDIEGAQEAIAELAQGVIMALEGKTNSQGVSYTELLDSERANGEGYVEAYEAELVKVLTKALTGTAAQGNAFRQAMVNRTDGLELSDFEATPKSKQSSKGPAVSVFD